ncbi:MAG TPA: dUTP diphosphatase [Desulfosarcina sp.]|nr:dUTP diphosphatase [Desulfosarcina sp.]
MPSIDFLRLNPDDDHDIPLPQSMTDQSAGMDVCAAIAADLTLPPGRISLVPTGFAMALPDGYEAQIRPRSGLAVNHGIGIINSPGTIDADYRGEVKIALINLGRQAVTIRRGDRIAQMVIQQVYRARINVVQRLADTDRSSGGFGHTGR